MNRFPFLNPLAAWNTLEGESLAKTENDRVITHPLPNLRDLLKLHGHHCEILPIPIALSRVKTKKAFAIFIIRHFSNSKSVIFLTLSSH